MKALSLDWDADTAPAIPLALVKSDLRITSDSQDALIQQHLNAAVRWAEGVMHRSILTKAHRWVIDEFPYDRLKMPRGKTQSVTSVQYVSNGLTTTLRGPSSGSPIGTDYQESLGGNSGGVLYPKRGNTWPRVDCDVPAPITVTFSAGWAITSIPKDIVSALMLDVQDRLDGSETRAKESLLSAWKLVRFY